MLRYHVTASLRCSRLEEESEEGGRAFHIRGFNCVAEATECPFDDGIVSDG